MTDLKYMHLNEVRKAFGIESVAYSPASSLDMVNQLSEKNIEVVHFVPGGILYREIKLACDCGTDDEKYHSVKKADISYRLFKALERNNIKYFEQLKGVDPLDVSNWIGVTLPVFRELRDEMINLNLWEEEKC